MRLVTASAKNHSRIRPSDSISAITTARAERLGRLLAGINIDCEPDRFRSACKIHCHDRVGLQSFSLGRTFLGNHYGAALTEHVIGKPAITMDLKKFIAGLAAGYRKLTVYEAGRKAG